MGSGTPCNQGICPQGYYCEEGSAWPTVCPSGKYNLNYREVSVAGCISCIEGYFCPDKLTITQCAAGTICVEGSPDDTTLPSVGHYSEEQYPAHIPCAAGTFQGLTGQSSCDSCTAGSQCPVTGMDVVETCDKGSDCSLAGVIKPKQCYYGQYLDPSNAVNPTCVDCPEDKFCWYDAIIESEITAESVLENSLLRAGTCPSGFKCAAGAYIPGMNVEYDDNNNAYMCREGNYCDNTASPVENQCPLGFYMPRTGAESLADCLQCKPGYECTADGTVTPTDCPSGMFCVVETGTSVDQCQPGTYCPTNAEMAFDCPYGSYSNTAGATSCTDVAAGYYQNAITQSTELDCPVGYYCELGTVEPLPCPMGSTSTQNAQAQSDCTDIPIGSYIASPSVFGTVTDGYSAPKAGEYYAIPTRFGTVCTVGHYCQAGVQADCVAGTKCFQEGLTVNDDGSDDCDAGYYCLAGTTRERPTSIDNYNGDICQPGGYCVTKSSSVTDCPAGSYSDAYGLTLESECHKCKNGYYCPNTGMQHADLVLCPAGSFCIESIDSTANAGTCGYGKKCPLGSMQELPCEKGYYQDTQGQAACIQCDSPNYCPFQYTLVAGTVSQKYTCDAGHQCQDNGMSAPTPCPVGYYQGSTGQTTCTKCDAGFYCPLQGTVAPIACPNQFYCPEGSVTPTLCLDGQICDSSDPSTQQFYTDCPAGFYCRTGIANACWAGYVCTGGAITPTPNSNDGTGYICPAGHHCDDGLNETPCATGYYNENYGASSIANCLICPSGTECLGTGNTNYRTISCTAGYICDGATQTPCDVGYYCPSGTLNMLMCPEGSYTDTTARTTCSACPEGTYCPDTATVVPTDCPSGFYCPEGTANYQIFPCPIGTFHDTVTKPSLSSQDECTDCTATFYCPRVAMLETDLATYPCGDGYICDTGSYTITGTDICPQNQYCIAGVPSFCPTGYYSPATGLPSSNECVACSPGKVCSIDTLTGSVNIWDCPAGFYCPGKIVQNSDATECPVGHYCPSGTGEPIQCTPGYYQDETQQSECKICDAGSYCDSSALTAPIDCATAYSTNYCPEGSIYPGKCPIGTFVNSDQTACEDCGAGRYCWPDTGSTGDIGDCDYVEGYLCRSGAWSPRPLISGLEFIQRGSNAFHNYNGPVLGGYYSEAGGVATACAVGKFQPSYYSQDCIDCYQGYYCPNTGMNSIANFRCAAGYYCELASVEEQPVGQTYGDICQVGRECGYTLVHPMFCPDGFISEVEGLAQCVTCPIGYYCDIFEEDVDPATPYECITQSSCTGGEKRQPICPTGTFHNTGEEYCQKCIAGHYCRAGIIAEQCAAGYICEDDDFYTQPDPAGTECEAGKYCPMGTTMQIWCPFETQSTATRAMQVTDCVACQPGYLCEFGQRNATECPPGHYCPPKADDLIYKGELYECPIGTYNPWTKKIYAFDCQDCEAGFYCNQTALVNITGKDCPTGHYCPKKTIQPIPCPPGTYVDYLGAIDEESCEGCTLGFYCPEGTSAPIECENGFNCPFYSSSMQTCRGGYYCNADTRYQEQDCPVNHYCPRGTGYPIPCDLKHTCGPRTEWQVFCPNGYYVIEQTIPGLANECKKCAPGTYSISTIDGCAPCPAGYLCYGGTNTDKPKVERYDFGEICGKGQYCPEGSYSPEFCPPGTFNANFGAKSLEYCFLCPKGSSNPNYGAEGCAPCGQFATSPEGSTQCTCIGENRVYSNADNSCRCKSGYDYKNTDGVSEGSLSDTTDCIPLVFDRCDKGQVRDPNGACVDKYDCSEICGVGGGVRDDVLGVCTCKNKPNIDEICNQDCRSKAPTYKYLSATKINMTQDGVTTTIDLADGREVFGNASQSTGNVRTVQMGGSGGFQGSYSAPESLLPKQNSTQNTTTVAASNSTANSTTKKKPPSSVNTTEGETATRKSRRNRKLQTTQITAAEQIPNPAYCINTYDTFLFTIESPTQYPVYMKDSVMNNNLQFDYGAFIDLASEMNRKQAQGDTTPSIFSFTFTESGNYVFQDASDTNQLLIITVKGLGEQCADPDRYLQIISGESLAQNGIFNREDIIIQPNYPLIVSMVCLLLFGTAFTMWMISYCMFKGWTIRDLSDDSYRTKHLGINIHHQNHKLFKDKNDFTMYKSDLITYEEDDLDNVNMDLQQEIVDTGKGYLRTYNKRRDKHKREKLRKRKEVDELMKEVEALVSVLNSDSTAAQMHWLDIDVLHEDTNEQVDDNKIKAQIERQMAALVRQEEHQLDQYKQKKDELLNAASELEREKYNRAHDNMITMQQEMAKRLNQFDESASSFGNETMGNGFAIYDNGDLKSKNNHLVKLIETNATLNDDEKERLLQSHESQLHNIDNIMEVERRKQENELDRALKERLDRRHRQREKTHGKQMREEHRDAELKIQSEFEERKASELERIQRDHDNATRDIMKNTDITIQRQQLQDLEELTEQKKHQAIIDLSNEQDRAIDSQKQTISKLHMQGLQNEQELADEVQKLMGQSSEVAKRMINQAEQERAAAEAAFEKKIALRQAERKKKLDRDVEQEIEAIEQMDVLAEHDKESLSMEAALKMKLKNLLLKGQASQTKNDSALATSFGLDRNGQPINDPSVVKAADVARKNCVERKSEMKEKLYQMGHEIDVELEKNSLLSQLSQHDATLAALLKEQDDIANSKLEARRRQLKARRIAKVKDDRVEEDLRFQIANEEEKQDESRKITEEYVRKLFKNVPKKETPEEKQHRTEILNEYLSDELMDQLAALLSKQYMESDALLKNCVHKYIQMDLLEETAIKEQFAIDLQALEKLKPQMSEEMYASSIKKLRVSEENMLQKQDLMVKREHAEEEARIRKELDRKHLSEQVELRQSLAQQHTQMRIQLLGEAVLNDPEYELERRALERYQQMKHTESERRIRQIELQKKTFTNQYESDMKQMHSDYDEMMRQKLKQQRDADEQEMSIRKRIQERKERVKKTKVDEGMTKEEQEAMIKNYQTQLEALDSAYTAEQRRQQLIMRAKLENRKNRMVKVKQLKQEMEKKPANDFQSRLGKAFASALKNQMVSTENKHEGDDSELLQRLREWKDHRSDYETVNFIKKAQHIGLQDGLDENQVRIMVVKLQQIEKLLKDLARKRKQKPKEEKPINAQRRRSSATSTASAFMNRLSGINRKATIKNEMITEGDEAEDSEGELLNNKEKVAPQKSILKKQSTTASKSFDTRGAFKPSASFTNTRI